MTKTIKTQNPKLEVADIFRKHLQDYRKIYPLDQEQRKVASDLMNCRTPKLGGQLDRCSHCGAERTLYHSCRNRHCPKCQQIPREKWLEKRKSELLPLTYFHIIFTLPHELNPIILKNKSLMINILFKAVSETLLTFGQNKLGGKMGFMAVLHTWDQQLKPHFHLHCLVPAGALGKKTKGWIPFKQNYLFNQEALSMVFRGKFMDRLKKTQIPSQQLKEDLYKHKWVVSVREPIKHPEHVLKYLARYTHRVAIANSRLTQLKDGMVSFKYKDRKNNTFKQTTITATQFIRRFLFHTLPKGLVRIRHYGFFANRNRLANLNLIRRLLKLPSLGPTIKHSLKQMMLKLTGRDISLCPCCLKGTMQPVACIPRHSGKHPHGFIRPPNYPLTAVL